MNGKIAVIGANPSDQRRLEHALREESFEVVDTEGAEAVIVSCVGRTAGDVSKDLRQISFTPTLVVGEAQDFPALERAVLEGARDFAIVPSSGDADGAFRELGLRLRRLLEGVRVPSGVAPLGRLLPRPRALVVEDDEDMRELVSLLLQEAYDVVGVSHGEEALALAKAQPPDVILLDILLPGMDGFTCLEALRKDSRTSEIPILLISSERSEAARVRSIESGAADYIAKPFLGKEMVARVGKAIRTARERQALVRLATTDSLTGMANFRSLHEQLEEEIRRARRYGHPLAIVMADMDNLKAINDHLGHEAGNRAIESLARVIQSGLRQTDFAARFGGDEFVILLPHSGLEDGVRLAERLRGKIHEMPGGPLALRASFGVTSFEKGTVGSRDELIARADEALYQAKKAGRDRVHALEMPGSA